MGSVSSHFFYFYTIYSTIIVPSEVTISRLAIRLTKAATAQCPSDRDLRLSGYHYGLIRNIFNEEAKMTRTAVVTTVRKA